MLRIEIGTAECAEGEVYVHNVLDDTDKFEIITAINTLYGKEGVISIAMYVEEYPGVE